MKALKALKVGRLKVEGWKTRRAACIGCGVDRRGKILTAGDVDRGPWRLPPVSPAPCSMLHAFYIGAVIWAALCFGFCRMAGERIAAVAASDDVSLVNGAEDLEAVRAMRLRMEATCRN